MINFSITWPSNNIIFTQVTGDQYTHLLVSNPLFVYVGMSAQLQTHVCMYMDAVFV